MKSKGRGDMSDTQTDAINWDAGVLAAMFAPETPESLAKRQAWETIREELLIAKEVVAQARAKATWLGTGRVLVGDATIVLTGRSADVVETMVKLQAASAQELTDMSGYADAVKYLKRAVATFPSLAPFIIFPGGKCRGGYRTTIVDGTT